MNFKRQIIEEVRKDEAVDAIFDRIEKEHGSKVQRIARFANADAEKRIYFTLILESYEMLEVCLKPAAFMGVMGMEVEIEVY